MTNFNITITSDPVCPWCYIGKKRLDAALSLYRKVYPHGRHDTFTLTWKAYYLDPSAPTHGLPYEARMLQKLAATRLNDPTAGAADATDEDRALGARLRERLAAIGRSEGLVFSFAGKIGSTRAAHRAVAFSRRMSNSDSDSEGQEQQDRFVMALFAAQFEGALDITSHAGLADVAESAGLSGAEMLAYLDGGAGGDEVDAEDREAREAGVRGVPQFVVQGVALDGAQDVQDLLEVFVRVKEEEKGGKEG